MRFLFKTKAFLTVELLALGAFLFGFLRREEGINLFLGSGLFFVLYFIAFAFYRAITKLNV